MENSELASRLDMIVDAYLRNHDLLLQQSVKIEIFTAALLQMAPFLKDKIDEGMRIGLAEAAEQHAALARQMQALRLGATAPPPAKKIVQ